MTPLFSGGDLGLGEANHTFFVPLHMGGSILWWLCISFTAVLDEELDVSTKYGSSCAHRIGCS